LLTRNVFSGVLYTYSSDKTDAQKSEIFIKIEVYSYRRAHTRASCSAGVICRGCGAVTCNTQPSVYEKRLGHPRIAGIVYSSHHITLDLFAVTVEEVNIFMAQGFCNWTQLHTGD